MDLYRFAPAEQVARIQAKFVRCFADIGAKRVLDLGCGRGIFLRLLRDAGIEGVGVDLSEEAVSSCRVDGLIAECADAITVLHRFADAGDSFDGIFCSHLVEHLPTGGIQWLIRRSAIILRPLGRLVIITPNVENLQVLTEGFWLDATHVRFVPRRLIESVMGDEGFRIIASGTDHDAVSGWHAASQVRKFLWHSILGRTITDRHLLSGLDAFVVGERPASQPR